MCEVTIIIPNYKGKNEHLFPCVKKVCMSRIEQKKGF